MYKKISFATLFLGFFLFSGVFGGIAVAQSTPPPNFFGGGIPQGPQSGSALLTIVTNVTNWIFVIVMVFAIVFIVLAGLQFITGGGDASAISAAKMKLMYAAIGIAVALLARGIPMVVRNIIGIT